MINIEIPEDVFRIVCKQNHHELPNTGAVYRFYDKEGSLIYIGRTDRLRERIHTHVFKGDIRSRAFRHHFYEVRGFFEQNPVYQDIYETVLINKLHPPCNRSKLYTYKSRWVEYVDPEYLTPRDKERYYNFHKKKRRRTRKSSPTSNQLSLWSEEIEE